MIRPTIFAIVIISLMSSCSYCTIKTVMEHASMISGSQVIGPFVVIALAVMVMGESGIEDLVKILFFFVPFFLMLIGACFGSTVEIKYFIFSLSAFWGSIVGSFLRFPQNSQ